MNKRKSNEQKKSLKSQLMSAVSMMLIAAVTLTSATYAWFMYVSNPEVKDIDLHVKAADSILLSPWVQYNMDPQDDDATTGYEAQDKPADYESSGLDFDPYNDASLWFGSISPAELTAAGQDTIFPDMIKDVSSIFTTAAYSGSMPFFGRTLDQSGTPTSFSPADGPGGIAGSVTGDYAKFDLWIKSDNDGWVYLNGEATSSLGFASNPLFTTTLSNVKGKQPSDPLSVHKKYIESTVRVGFFTENEGSYSQGSTPKAVVWEPNSRQALPVTFGGPSSSYLTANQQSGTGMGTPPNSMYKIKTEAITTEDTIANPATGLEGTPTLQTTFDFGTNSTNYSVSSVLNPNRIALFYLEKDTAVKFSIYIWVEGQDPDTVNSVANSDFITYLQFGQEPVPIGSVDAITAYVP